MERLVLSPEPAEFLALVGRERYGLTSPLRVEIKMARFYGDNGKPDDTGIKDILSPFAADRSAVADAVKLTRDASPGRTAILIYGFDAPARPVLQVIEAFEVASMHPQVLWFTR